MQNFALVCKVSNKKNMENAKKSAFYLLIPSLSNDSLLVKLILSESFVNLNFNINDIKIYLRYLESDLENMNSELENCKMFYKFKDFFNQVPL